MISYLTITLLPLAFGLVVFFKSTPSAKQIKFLLAFSGAFILGISFLHLIPEVFEVKNNYAPYFILGGFFLQVFLEYFSQGIEHGHIHLHSNKKAFPFAIFLSLCIHALIEGMPINSHAHHHHDHESNSLLVGIILHKIPIAITLSSFLIASGSSKMKGILGLILFCSMAPLGMLISEFSVPSEYLNFATAFVVGMLLHISTTILFESSEGHKFNITKLLTIIFGIGLAILSVSI